MKIVVPMAGRGSRLRPHTLTIPKPLVPVGGKPIVHRLVQDIAKTCTEKIDEIAFVIGDFGKDVENELIKVAEELGAKGKIYYQDKALGTAHAVLCAADSLKGPVVVAFADTLFKADFTMDEDADGVLWVKQIDDPSAFGVVQLDEEGFITDFVEKPSTFVSDLAMIGIYYFKEAEKLKTELQYLIDNGIIKGGEYQLPDALRNLTEKGAKFVNKEDWGLKKLAYPIQNKKSGFYHLFEFTVDGTAINPLEVEFRRDERVMRYLTVKLDKHAIAWAEKRVKKIKANAKA